MNAGDEVVQTAIQGDDHRVAGGPVQLKQVNGCFVRVEAPRLGEVVTCSKGHGFHQIDAHAGGRVIAGRSQHGERITGLVQSFDQQLKPDGFDAIVVGEQQPATGLNHEQASGRCVLIVRFKRGLF